MTSLSELKAQIELLQKMLKGQNARDFVVPKAEREQMLKEVQERENDPRSHVWVTGIGTHGEIHYHTDKCPKCGGSGHVPYRPDGGVCYKCGGSGHFDESWTVIPRGTPYAKFHADTKLLAHLQKEMGKFERWAEACGFTSEDPYVYAVASRDTFSFKDTLKEQGAKFAAGMWYFTKKPDNYETIPMSIDECLDINCGEFMWNEMHANILFKERLNEVLGENTQTGEFFGTEGKRENVTFKIVHIYFVENDYSYYGGTIQKNVGEDECGHTFMLNGDFGEKGSVVTVKATVKSHWTNKEGKKITILSRAKLV